MTISVHKIPSIKAPEESPPLRGRHTPASPCVSPLPPHSPSLLTRSFLTHNSSSSCSVLTLTHFTALLSFWFFTFLSSLSSFPSSLFIPHVPSLPFPYSHFPPPLRPLFHILLLFFVFLPSVFPAPCDLRSCSSSPLYLSSLFLFPCLPLPYSSTLQTFLTFCNFP